MEERLDRYAKQYVEAVRTLPDDERDEASRDRDESYADIENWTRRARIKIWQHTQENPPQAYGPGRNHLQKVPLPYFFGKAKNGRNSGGTSRS